MLVVIPGRRAAHRDGYSSLQKQCYLAGSLESLLIRWTGMAKIQVSIQGLMKTEVYVEGKGIRGASISALIHTGGKLTKAISCLGTILLV